MSKQPPKPAAKAAVTAPRPGTREHRDQQRAEFNRKMDAQKKKAHP